MTNRKAIDAIAAHSAHDLADALADAEVSTARTGNRGSDDESCDIPGYGTIYYHDLAENPGWVVRADCDYPVDDCELAAELAEIVEWAEQIS